MLIGESSAANPGDADTVHRAAARAFVQNNITESGGPSIRAPAMNKLGFTVMLIPGSSQP
jgi:hypothetical protein